VNEVVREYLIMIARRKTNQTVHYQKLCDDCRLDLNMHDKPYDRAIIGRILGEISKYEHLNSRPLLSALVLRSEDHEEGDGFYKLAEELGFGSWHQLKKEGIFQVQQMTDCINFWNKTDNYINYR
jgi:hypothetical protein